MVSKSDIQYAIQKFIQSFTFYQNQTVTPGKLSDGLFFGGILSTVKKFKIASTLLNPKADKWPNKLKNLKIILEKVEEFFEEEVEKGIKTRDIDLVKIVKENNIEEINKLFEVIVSVLMEGPNKQEYIQSIMQLDQRCQNAFVEIIQNCMDSRVCSKQECRQNKMAYIIKQLETENISLKDQLDSIYKHQQSLERQIKDYEEKMLDFENQLDNSKYKRQEYSYQDSEVIEEKYQKLMGNLKMKLINQTKDHQIQIATFQEKVTQLEEKLADLQNYEEMAEFYKEKYEEVSAVMSKSSLWEREKIKLLKIIDEKEISISKMQQKLEQLTEKCIQFQQNEIYNKMELKKYQVKLQQAQKCFKSKINNNQSAMLMISQYQKLNISKMCSEKQNKYECQASQSNNLQAKIKNLQRENSKLQRKLEKTKQLQLEKKKLESIIIDINHNQNQQLKIITAALCQTYVENKKIWQAFRYKPNSSTQK